MEIALIALGFAGGTLTLSACSPAEPPHDIAYYRDHGDVRADKLMKCWNDPGGIGKSANCVNAIRADGDALTDKAWKTLTPASRVTNLGQLRD